MLLEAGEQMAPRMFGLDLQLLFDSGLTLLAVFVLFLILSYNLFNPARKILKDRRDRIANDIAVAQNDKDGGGDQYVSLLCSHIIPRTIYM